jgi:hypothetical protein
MISNPPPSIFDCPGSYDFTTSYNCWNASSCDVNCSFGHLNDGMFVSGESSRLSVEQKQLGAAPHGFKPRYSSPVISFCIDTPSPFGCGMSKKNHCQIYFSILDGMMC